MELIYLKSECGVIYPVGDEYPTTTYHYVREVARVINKTFPEGDIILVVRGTSGTILAGGVAYLLSRKGRNVTITVSRKSGEVSHSHSLANLYFDMEGIFIILDDFISSGETVDYIIKDLRRQRPNLQLDMLCVSNYWDYSDSDKSVRVQNLLQNFKYVCCNKPRKEDE